MVEPTEDNFEADYYRVWGEQPSEDYEYWRTSKVNLALGLYAQENPSWEGYDYFSQFIPGIGDDSTDDDDDDTDRTGTADSSLWNIPDTPDIYDVPGLPGVPQLPDIYDVPDKYNIPSLKSLMPYEGWYKDIDPNLRDYVWEPYQEGSEKLARELAGVGMYGSQKAGMSGAAADVFKDYNIDASQDVTASLWDMTYPGMEKHYGTQVQQEQDYWNALLGQAKTGYASKMEAWGEQAGREMTGWDALLGQAKTEYGGNWKLWDAYLDKNKWPYDNLLSFLQESMADIFTGYGDEPTIY